MADLESRTGHRKNPSQDNYKPRFAKKQWTRSGYNPPSPRTSRYDRYTKSHARVNGEPSPLRVGADTSSPSRIVRIDYEDRESVVKPLSERIAPGAAGGAVALGRHRVEPPVNHEVPTGPRLSGNQKTAGKSPQKRSTRDTVGSDQSSSKLYSHLWNGLRDTSFPEAFPTNGYSASREVIPSTLVGGARQQGSQRDNSEHPSSKRSLLGRIGPLVVQNANLRLRLGQSTAEISQRVPSTSIDRQSVEAALTPDVCASIVSSMTAASKQYVKMKGNDSFVDRVRLPSEGQDTEYLAANLSNMSRPPQANNHISRSPAPLGLNQRVSMSKSRFSFPTLAGDLPLSSGVALDENGDQEGLVHGTNNIILPTAQTSSLATESSVPPAPAPARSPVPISIPISPAFFINAVSAQGPTAPSPKGYTHESPNHHRRFSDGHKSTEHAPLSSYARPHKRYRSPSPPLSPSSRYQNDNYSGWSKGRPPSQPPYYCRRSPPSPTLSIPYQSFEPSSRIPRHPKSPMSRSPELRQSGSPRQAGSHHLKHNEHYSRPPYRRQPSPPLSALPNTYLPSSDYSYSSRAGKESPGTKYLPNPPLPMSEKHFSDGRRYGESDSSTEYPSRYNLKRSRKDDDRGRECPRPPIDELNAGKCIVDGSAAAVPQSASATVLKLAIDSPSRVDRYPSEVDKTPITGPVQIQDIRESEETVVQESLHDIPGLWFVAEGLDTPDVFECSFEVSPSTALSWHLPLLWDMGESRPGIISGDPTAELKKKPSPTVSLQLKCLPAELVHAAQAEVEFVESKDLTRALSGIPCKWPPRGKLIIEVNPDQKLRKTLLPKDLVNASILLLFNPTEGGQEDSVVSYVELNLHIHEGSNLVRFIHLGDLSEYVFILHATPVACPRSTGGRAQENIEHEIVEHDLPVANLQCLLTKPKTRTKSAASLLAVQNPSIEPMTSAAM